jgi:hypothetical protein
MRLAGWLAADYARDLVLYNIAFTVYSAQLAIGRSNISSVTCDLFSLSLDGIRPQNARWSRYARRTHALPD